MAKVLGLHKFKLSQRRSLDRPSGLKEGNDKDWAKIINLTSKYVKDFVPENIKAVEKSKHLFLKTLPPRLRKGGMAHRGKSYNSRDDFYEAIEKITKKQFKMRPVTSWGRDLKVAKFMANHDLGDMIMDYGIVFSKRIGNNEVLIDVPVFIDDRFANNVASFLIKDNFHDDAYRFGSKESEIVVMLKNLTISKIDIGFIYIKGKFMPWSKFLKDF